MQIGILGSGLMGTALGTAWATAGHQVTFSYSRDMQKLETLARRVGHGARAGLPSDAARADVILMSTHWNRVPDVLRQTGALGGKIIVSCMLPMTDDDQNLVLGFNTSGAEELAKRTGAQVIGTFNTVWSNAIRATRSNTDTRPSMFYVGEAETACQTAELLIRDVGFEPIHVGGLENARHLEPFGLLMGKLGFAYDPLVSYRFLKP